jgi:hypothetical protein
MLDERRCEAIQFVIESMKKLPSCLERDVYECSDACRTVLLRYVSKHICALRFTGQVFVQAESPFYGTSFELLSSKLSSRTKPPAWYSRMFDAVTDPGGHACTLNFFVDVVLQEARDGLTKAFGDTT